MQQHFARITCFRISVALENRHNMILSFVLIEICEGRSRVSQNRTSIFLLEPFGKCESGRSRHDSCSAYNDIIRFQGVQSGVIDKSELG
jgi:hypothetical protein